ncbi:MAG: hypothetical protein ACM3WV_07335 [Bacillota bacterium]
MEENKTGFNNIAITGEAAKTKKLDWREVWRFIFRKQAKNAFCMMLFYFLAFTHLWANSVLAADLIKLAASGGEQRGIVFLYPGLMLFTVILNNRDAQGFDPRG